MDPIEILTDHEWAWKEGYKQWCATCGAEHREKTKLKPFDPKKHRVGCGFIAMVEWVKRQIDQE